MSDDAELASLRKKHKRERKTREPVSVADELRAALQATNAELKEARRERDEARREVCELKFCLDCFKEEP